MLKQEMIDAINKQINEELYSSYLYLAMAGYFEDIGLKGFSNWMMVQYKEELDHAHIFINYLFSQGASLKLEEIKKPPQKWNDPLHVFTETLKHEQHITERINELVDLAEKLKDRATYNLLQWFIDEQVEEEENDREIIDKLKLVQSHPHGLFMLDKELAARTYTPASKLQQNN